jgi:hypothetical protein
MCHEARPSFLFVFFIGKFLPKIEIKNDDFGGFQSSKKRGGELVKVAIFL